MENTINLNGINRGYGNQDPSRQLERYTEKRSKEDESGLGKYISHSDIKEVTIPITIEITYQGDLIKEKCSSRKNILEREMIDIWKNIDQGFDIINWDDNFSNLASMIIKSIENENYDDLNIIKNVLSEKKNELEEELPVYEPLKPIHTSKEFEGQVSNRILIDYLKAFEGITDSLLKKGHKIQYGKEERAKFKQTCDLIKDKKITPTNFPLIISDLYNLIAAQVYTSIENNDYSNLPPTASHLYVLGSAIEKKEMYLEFLSNYVDSIGYATMLFGQSVR